MDDAAIEQFVTVTSSDYENAKRYLHFAGGDLDSAVMLFFESGGQMPETAADTPNHELDLPTDSAAEGDHENDEAIARRLAAQWAAPNVEIRPPIAPTRQVLQNELEFFDNPGFSYPSATSIEGVGRASRTPRGIFNQVAPSVWDEHHEEQALLEATGGASGGSDKSSRLARLFQPPFDLMHHVDLSTARVTAKAESKWILVNIQDSSDFPSQTLNRDLWKDREVKAIVKESFYFLQYTKESQDGQSYIQFYPIDTFPHISIIDPRTGERVKLWSKSIDSAEFISEATEFLDRFSLDVTAQNPIARKPRACKKVFAEMSEEEQMNAAIMASVGASAPIAIDSSDGDDDSVDTSSQALDSSTPAETMFSKIPIVTRNEPISEDGVTKIQLRLPSGSRVVRRFRLKDPVQHIFEFVKSEVELAKGKAFKVAFNRLQLINKLNTSIGDAGLKNASLIVELEEE